MEFINHNMFVWAPSYYYIIEDICCSWQKELGEDHSSPFYVTTAALLLRHRPPERPRCITTNGRYLSIEPEYKGNAI